MSRQRRPLSAQGTRWMRAKKPDWDDTLTDLAKLKLTPAELEARHAAFVSKNTTSGLADSAREPGQGGDAFEPRLPRRATLSSSAGYSAGPVQPAASKPARRCSTACGWTLESSGLASPVQPVSSRPLRRCSTACAWLREDSEATSSEGDAPPRTRNRRTYSLGQNSMDSWRPGAQACQGERASAGPGGDSRAEPHTASQPWQPSAGLTEPVARRPAAGDGRPADKLDVHRHQGASSPGAPPSADEAAVPAENAASSQLAAAGSRPAEEPAAAANRPTDAASRLLAGAAAMQAQAASEPATQLGCQVGLVLGDPASAAGELDMRVRELRTRLERAEAAAASAVCAGALRREVQALQAEQRALQAEMRKFMAHTSGTLSTLQAQFTRLMAATPVPPPPPPQASTLTSESQAAQASAALSNEQGPGIVKRDAAPELGCTRASASRGAASLGDGSAASINAREDSESSSPGMDSTPAAAAEMAEGDEGGYESVEELPEWPRAGPRPAPYGGGALQNVAPGESPISAPGSKGTCGGSGHPAASARDVDESALAVGKAWSPGAGLALQRPSQGAARFRAPLGELQSSAPPRARFHSNPSPLPCTQGCGGKAAAGRQQAQASRPAACREADLPARTAAMLGSVGFGGQQAQAGRRAAAAEAAVLAQAAVPGFVGVGARAAAPGADGHMWPSDAYV